MPVPMLPPAGYRPIKRGRAFIEEPAPPPRKVEPIRPPIAAHRSRMLPQALESSSYARSAAWSYLAAELLALAYERPCFLCGKTGWCKHREPEVELALMGARMERGTA